MEEKPNPEIEIEFSETNRGRQQVIVNRKYKFNFSSLRKNNSKVFRCTEYKTVNKCKSLVILNGNNEVIRYDSTHNHLEKEVDVSLSIAKHKIRDEIRKSSNLFDVKPKRLFNEVYHEMGFICPEYKRVKSQITRNINKQLPPDIKSFDDIPNESQLYRTERNDNFMIYKDYELIIFQSPFQAELFTKYNEDIYTYSYFYTGPTYNLYAFVTKAYITELNDFYTTSFSLLRNKKQETYEKLFEEIKKNVSPYNSGIGNALMNFHCVFEKSIFHSVKKVFPNVNIKYYIWHYKRSLEIQKNKLCYREVEDNNNIYIYYKAISNFPYINPMYINDIYKKIENECQSLSYYQFSKFLEYFKKTYLHSNGYDKSNWNFYNNEKYLTNNTVFNVYFGKLFSKKTSFFKIIHTVKKDESKFFQNYHERTEEENSNKKIKVLNEIDNFIRNYREKESELIANEASKSEIIDLWFKCLYKLNDRFS